MERRGGSRRENLVEVAVLLRPERRSPGLVQGLDRAVPGAEPGAERLGRDVAVTVADVTAVLVVDVPHLDGRMAGVTVGDRGGQSRGTTAVDRGTRAVLLAAANREADPVGGHGKGLGVSHAEPWRRRRSRGGEVDPDSAGVQARQDFVEPREIEVSVPGL